MSRNHTNDRLKKERIGEVVYNYYGQRVEIIDYISHDNITVRFDDGTIRENVYYSCFKNGIVKNFEAPIVYGVGVPGYKPKKVNGKIIKEYSTWSNMLQRCYDPEKQEEFPRYKECRVSDEWLYFDNFYEWCHRQDNWNKVMENPSKFHLDKDIISKGNKIYGAKYCSFVPADVNILFVKRERDRGEYPIGVKKLLNGKFQAICSMKQIGEGILRRSVDTPEKAFLIYKENKERLIKTVGQREYDKGNIVKKCYEAMMNYEVQITD